MSTSPPPTPPGRDPRSRSERRFEQNGAPCEWSESYHPGGYHPVHLGDLFDEGRFKVIGKLGYGSFSTVWLARDIKYGRYVAFKILVSRISESTQEEKILNFIFQSAPEEGSQYITPLLDTFNHHGPNGTHKCLVFEPMGPTVNGMVEELPQLEARYPPQIAKRILKQALESLSFLHRYGIAHGDFQPGNMLFSLDDIDSKPEEEFLQVEDIESSSISSPLKRLDGKKDKWARHYLCIAQTLVPFTNYTKDFRIKLSDMGGAYQFSALPAKVVTPVGLRAPELVLYGAMNRTLDIWSFGCLVFELITGRRLFCSEMLEPGWEDDEHLLEFIGRLGPLPGTLFKDWKTSHLYYTPEGKLYNAVPGGQQEGEAPMVELEHIMGQYFDEAKPDLEEAEAREVKELIRWILQYDPAKRPSPEDILRHPWFSDV